MIAAATTAGPGEIGIGMSPIRREVHKFDQGATNVQSNVTDVAGILMRQNYAWSISVSVS